jgi:hypothetical protein
VSRLRESIAEKDFVLVVLCLSNKDRQAEDRACSELRGVISKAKRSEDKAGSESLL